MNLITMQETADVRMSAGMRGWVPGQDYLAVLFNTSLSHHCGLRIYTESSQRSAYEARIKTAS